MDAADKRMLEREALRNMIQQWNANRLDLFELSEPNENLEFHGVMRFYFQDSGQKIATKCIRVASDATVSDVIETLIEKFRPDMRMLSLGSYSLWETHGPDDERRLEPHEKPLLVQLNWHADDREGRFLLKCLTNNETNSIAGSEKGDQNFKRKLSKREKKELKKKEKLSRLKSDNNEEKRPVAEKLYTELPETSFTRSISNPEAVMRRRRHQKLERKLQQFRSKDGQPDTGGTLKIYGSSLCQDVPYKTLLLSVGDNAASVVREMLEKYGLSRHDPHHYCIVQVDTTDNSEYVLEDDECPLAVVMTHPHSSSIMFHVRRRPADAQPRRRKKKTGSSAGGRPGLEPLLVEVSPDGSALENGLRVRVNDVIEVGSGNGVALQLYGPSIQARHCVVAPADGGGYQVTPLHCDAGVWLDGRPVLRPTSLQHGSLLKFGRISTFRFVDPAQENMLSRNMAQAPHYGSGSIYDSRSPTSGDNASGAMSPTSMASHQPDNGDANANTTEEYPRTMSPAAHDGFSYTDNMPPYNNNTLKLDNESLMMSQHLNESKDDFNRDEPSGQPYNDQDQASVNRTANSQYKDNYETTFDLDGNVETKSICSAKSGGSGHDNRMNASVASVTRPGQEAILPAVLEFPEAGQAQFLNAVVTRLDPHAPAFKLAPVYTLYLCARYRASTHYRPELSPTERAHKLTAFLHHVATLIHATVQERCTDSAAQAFWMANASELLHFLKCDRHISSFSLQAQDLLPTTVQNAFSNLVSCFQEELARALATLTNPNLADASEATAPTLQALASAMVLLRRCRVNAALTIQLFSHLFHYINAVCFNKLVTEPGAVNPRWGSALSARLGALTAWAERQGLELAADCHLARTQQAARLIQGEYRTPDEGRAALEACFKLNSIQVGALLSPITNADVVDACVGKARALADELYRADGRQIRLEESEWLGAALLIPGDGFSAEVVRGVPPGLAEFIAPLQRGGLCRLAHQPHAIGLWTVYMAGQRNMRPPDPRIHIIQLNKNSNGMGLSIVAAKGAGQSKLGIYIKSVVAGGAAAADGRLAAGDQLLSVDGHSLLGISQEKAAEYLVRTGPTVTLEVAKQGAVLHGLATLLHQPAYNQRQGYGRRPCRDRCRLVRDDSTGSSTEDSEDCHPHYHGSIPRLIITLDHENNQLQEDLSPETPGCPLELKCHPAPPRPIPVFTFTCEDFDELQSRNKAAEGVPPPVPEPPTNYDQSSETGEPICLPPQMRPIDTKLTLDLFNIRTREPDFYRGRCTGVDECVSACECCRAQQPEDIQIPYIDEPNSEPLIFENDCADERVATPKIRRILPSMSIDQSEECKPSTADAECQTPSTPVETDAKAFPITKIENNIKEIPKSKPQTNNKSLILNLDIDQDGRKLNKVHHRLKKTLFSVSKSFSTSEETNDSSTFTTTDSYNEQIHFDKQLAAKTPTLPPLESSAKKILDSTNRKSWKSPDEYRPSLGTVKALTKHFDNIKLKYSVKNYQRNCQSSPNLSMREDKSFKVTENLPSSMSLADIQFETTKTDTSDTKGEKLSEDEVKSILIQLEDWSRFGSKGSGDTLAQGNEFELPNLPSEDHTDTNISNTGSLVFNEIIDKKPKIITLDNIKLKSNQSSINSVLKSKESLVKSSSLEKVDKLRIPRVVAMIPSKHSSLLDVSPRTESRRESYSTVMQSCPNVNCGSSKGRSACAGGNPHNSCPALGSALTSSDALSSGDNARRASERALSNSKSTPALHQAEPPNNLAGAAAAAGGAAAWAAKSRSSHNLAAAAPHDAFYQNLPALHHHPDHRWSSLRSSGSNRPQSAHFSAQNHENPPDSPLHQQNHAAMTARAAKLAEMSEEVTRRQQLQFQQKQALSHHHNQMYTSQPVLNQNPLLSPNMAPPPPLSTTQHLSQSQHLTPNQQIKNQNQHMMSPGQQMHNHMNLNQTMSPNQHLMGSNQQLLSPNQQMMTNQQMMSPNQQMMSPNPQMMSPNQQMMSPNQQLLNQSQQMLNQSQQMLNQNQMHVHPGQAHVQYASQPSPQLGMHQQTPPSQIYHNQNLTQQRYDWHSNGPPSPQRAQPPVAPKPQNLRRPDMDHEEHHPIQQPLNVSIQPEEDQYTSGAETGSLYNPWQREEREKQVEARRAAARDGTIAHLISLGSNRTPMQNQQLRALQLERDIERRANQLEADDNTNTETGTEEEERISPERERMMSERDRSNSERDRAMAERERTMSDRERAMSERERGPPNPLPNPPKSILKTNKPEPQTNGFANEIPMVRSPEPPAPGPATGAGGLQAAVPPVPERGSSFAVMARIKPAPTSPVGRDKRVSFHSNPPPPPPASSPPREDPDRFIEEAENMLTSPATPPGPAPAQHTPGVIGAQEVYRDPRNRRLEEQRARAAAAPVPEQLSFHEKMKMFALEAGDRAEPRDKVKISRAQRDIDAVH